MDLTPISQVTKECGVSSRALRYYESLGLVKSSKTDDYAYRVYDDAAILRVRQIVALRKLKVSLKRIAQIFRCPEAEEIAKIFAENAAELTEEIDALKAVRSILITLAAKAEEAARRSDKSNLFNDETVVRAIESVPLSPNQFKEVQTMKDWNRMFQLLSKLDDVRIVRLPAFTVAALRTTGANPEEAGGEALERFLKSTKLYEIMPSARQFGFNVPNPPPDGIHSYETWVTVPDDFEVPEPFAKKRFQGGLFAVHTIAFGDFYEWERLKEWSEQSEKYAADYGNGEGTMAGCMEEGLNYVYYSHLGWPKERESQMDLYLPIKLK